MSGKLCAGQDPTGKSPDVMHSKAYCEGRLAAKNGVLVGANPYEAGSTTATAWSTGHATWVNDPALGPAEGRDCCAEPFGGGYTPP